MPDLHGNLLSVTQLTAQGIKVRFKDHFCRIYSKEEILTGERTHQGDLYIMDTETMGIAKAYTAKVNELPHEGDKIQAEANMPTMSTGSKVTLGMWHRRLGHLHSKAILQMARKGMVKGMEI